MNPDLKNLSIILRKKNDEDNRRDTPKKDHSTLDTISRPAVISDMINMAANQQAAPLCSFPENITTQR